MDIGRSINYTHCLRNSKKFFSHLILVKLLRVIIYVTKSPSFSNVAAISMYTYFTFFLAYYALSLRRQMKPGNSLLVHARTGGVGQAAIAIALYMGVTAYTTVVLLIANEGELLKKTFPKFTDKNIANSREISLNNMY